MTINIDQTIADLHTYAESSLDQNGNFAIIVNRYWFSPALILPNSRINLEDILSEKFDQCKIDFVAVNAYSHGKNIYSKTLNPPKPGEPKPEYKQITMEGVTYNLVPLRPPRPGLH